MRAATGPLKSSKQTTKVFFLPPLSFPHDACLGCCPLNNAEHEESAAKSHSQSYRCPSAAANTNETKRNARSAKQEVHKQQRQALSHFKKRRKKYTQFGLNKQQLGYFFFFSLPHLSGMDPGSGINPPPHLPSRRIPLSSPHGG